MLSATAALRGGAGLVTAAVPESVRTIVASFEPSYMTVGLPCDGCGNLDLLPPEKTAELVAGKDAVAVGPGLGQSKQAADLVLSVLKESSCPVVLDADALNLAAEYEILRNLKRDQPTVITPHPGEFARLTGRSVSEIQADRDNAAVQFAQEFGVIVVLKGPGTVVTDGRRIYVNSTGNAGLATGGSGDVLTGVIAAQLAFQPDPTAAACLGVFIHGLAGDLGVADMSEPGLIASDLLRFLGPAWRNYQNELSD